MEQQDKTPEPQEKRQPIQPTQTLLQGMPYTNWNKTDVRKTWEKFGWKPVQSK